MSWSEKSIPACRGMMSIVLSGDHLAEMLQGILSSAGTMPRYLNTFTQLHGIHLKKLLNNHLFIFQRNKAPNEQTIPLLIPRHYMVLPHYMGRSSEINIKGTNAEENPQGHSRHNSFSSESPLDDIPLLLPQEADPQSNFDLDHKPNGPHAHRDHHVKPSVGCESLLLTFLKSKADDSVKDTQMKGFVDEVDCLDCEREDLSEVAQFSRGLVDEQEETSEEGDNDVTTGHGQVGPRVTCRCQVDIHH